MDHSRARERPTNVESLSPSLTTATSSNFFILSFLWIIAMGVRRAEGAAVDFLWDQIWWNSVVTTERVIVRWLRSQEPNTE
jgi:hypothetical protein